MFGTPHCEIDRQRVAAHIAAGDFDQLFASAERLKFPICLNLPYNTSVLLPALERYPRLTFILDHFGVRFPDLIEPAPGRYEVLNQILGWSTYKNLFLKVSHVEWLSLDGYPFADMVPYLRKLIDAYGANRIMWGSDATEASNPARSPRPCTWGEALHYLLDSPDFSRHEKDWLLGRTFREVFNWGKRRAGLLS